MLIIRIGRQVSLYFVSGPSASFYSWGRVSTVTAFPARFRPANPIECLPFWMGGKGYTSTSVLSPSCARVGDDGIIIIYADYAQIDYDPSASSYLFWYNPNPIGSYVV